MIPMLFTLCLKYCISFTRPMNGTSFLKEDSSTVFDKIIERKLPAIMILYYKTINARMHNSKEKFRLCSLKLLKVPLKVLER